MHFESCDFGVSNLFAIIGWPTILDTPPKATKQPAGQPCIHWLICMMSGLDKTTTQLSGDVKVFCVSVDGKMTGGHEYEKLLESVGELHSILEITCLF